MPRKQELRRGSLEGKADADKGMRADGNPVEQQPVELHTAGWSGRKAQERG